MAHKPTITTRGRPNAQGTTKVFSVPAPINGIDARNLLGQGNPRNCIYAYNMVPDETGVRVRKGYREWAIGLATPVRTIIPFKSAKPENDRLFVATSDGIYDATVYAATPVIASLPADWTLTGDDAGWGVFINYVTLGGDTYCFYADQVNGLFMYSDLAPLDGWVRPTGITGIPLENVNFVTSHKLRIWFGVENSATAHYLDPNSIAGAVTDFPLGASFKHGGALKGLFNWTVDGGVGVDDYLVAVSTSGDVSPYQGSDPSQTDWGIAGSYYIGEMVKGARCGSRQGGNLHLLSSFGLISMSDLLRGVDPMLPDAQSISAKIAPFIRSESAESLDKNGWAVLNLASEGVIALVTPNRLTGEDIEYIYNISVDGWGLWRGIPINCIDTWGQSPYIGTVDGRVLVMDVSKDDVRLNPEVGVINGENVQFSIMLSYSDLGEGGVFKRGMLSRPDFISGGQVSAQSKFFYDYDTSEILTTPKDAGTKGFAWDISNWDDAIWNTDSLNSTYTTQGASGMGRSVTLAIKGNCLSDTIFASVDVFFSSGGAL